MAIDIREEKLITLTAARNLAWLPRRPSFTTVIRWATVGIKDMKLETLRVGRTLCTSEPAMLRFFERQTQPAGGDAPTPSQRRKQLERAHAALDAAGI